MKISLNFVPEGPINYKQSLVQEMAGHQTGDEPFSESMVA